MNKKEFFIGIVVITFICALSGYLLSYIYKITMPRIEKIKKIKENKINKEIFPEGVNFIEKEMDGIKYISVLNLNDEEIGKIFEVKTLGYGGYIYLKVGIDKDMKIKGIKIKEHSETPGLGSKITENKFLDQFTGKTKDDIYLKKDNPNGKIDAVTGATISSRSVVESVRKLLEKIKEEK
ncbi:MAG: RnfABCDGE type electron transport complex subunit G [Candidatus Omnitrophica bacterium]|nr:RnfABCDGE type electron transport complex subunit G [Candidatus Omnitrophota bacterium]MCM8807729.1 RnfABCDGE type electron transport complex subunit G [Candidatus Omnitrophota bacterium]